jgi:hypothetical protein
LAVADRAFDGKCMVLEVEKSPAAKSIDPAIAAHNRDSSSPTPPPCCCRSA